MQCTYQKALQAAAAVAMHCLHLLLGLRLHRDGGDHHHHLRRCSNLPAYHAAAPCHLVALGSLMLHFEGHLMLQLLLPQHLTMGNKGRLCQRLAAPGRGWLQVLSGEQG